MDSEKKLPIIDDTEFIQKALNAAAEKGGICVLPKGSYNLKSELVIPKGVILKGTDITLIIKIRTSIYHLFKWIVKKNTLKD